MSSLFCVREILTKWNSLLVFMGIHTKSLTARLLAVCTNPADLISSAFLLSSLEKGRGGKRGTGGMVGDIIMTTYIMQSIVWGTQSVHDEMT